MKIAICQINSLVGGCKENTDKILHNYLSLLDLNPNIIVFPELSITGYPPQDLLFDNDFVKFNIECAEKISRKSTTPIIFGFVRLGDNGDLYNSAAVCYNGSVQSIYDKTLLPSYDVFDETRYFNKGVNNEIVKIPIENKIIKIGLQICEDLWDTDYDYKVTEVQHNSGADLFINISSSPFSKNKINERINLIKQKVDKFNKPFIYCNMVGGQDELIFDGSSLAFNQNSELVANGKSFKEDIILVDFKGKQKKTQFISEPEEEQFFKALSLGIRDYFKKTGHNEAVLGLSGGIDSAVVACIASEALSSSKVHTISLPSKYSSKHSLDDAIKLSKNLNVDHRVIKINDVVNVIGSSLKPHFIGTKIDVTEENIQARVRGNILMALSNKFNWLLLSTGNKTELALGYCTLYGDMSGGLSVISDLSKMQVYKLAKWINQNYPDLIPENIINKPPSAELAYNQVDPFDYNIVSPMVDELIEKHKSPKELIEDGFDKDLVTFIYNRIKSMEFKRRQSPIGFKISKKAFGLGRRIPIVNHFKG